MSETIQAPNRLFGTTGASMFRVAQTHTTIAFASRRHRWGNWRQPKPR